MSSDNKNIILQIRNMVSSRCIAQVQNILESASNISIDKVYLGAAQIQINEGSIDLIVLQKKLQENF